MSREQSTIGAAQSYGPRETNAGLPNSVSTYGPFRIQEVYFDYEEANAGLPTLDADTDSAVLRIPANSIITRAYLHVTTAFTSGGSATLELGVQDYDGTANDPDGLDSIAVAALTGNSIHVLDGSLVGATIGTTDGQIQIDDATDTFTAGEGRLVVEYMIPTV